jgi:predicted kinase
MLIIVCGLPGTGKTTLAEGLSRALQAVHVSSDIIRKKAFARPSYSEGEKAAVYSEMAKQCEEALANGDNAVADATFYRESERWRFASLAKAAGTRAFIVLCTLPEEEIRRRLGVRGKGGPSDADYAVYERLKAGFEPLKGAHLAVDSRLPETEKIRRVMEFAGR